MAHNPLDFGFARISALRATQRAGAGLKEEHIAFAEQLVGAHLVENDAAVRAAGNLEADARRQVRLDEAGDDIDGGLLRGEDEVDAGGPGFLSESDDVALDFL